MDEQTKSTQTKLTAPLLYLSSADAGWEGVTAQAFHEPLALEGWLTAPAPEVSLVLFRGGSMQIARRYQQSAWQTANIHHGELILQGGTSQPYEVRWYGLSATPIQTLHLHLKRGLLARTAEDVTGCDVRQLMFRGRVGFQDPLLAQIGFALWRELEERAPAGKLYAQTAAQLLAVHLLRHYTTLGAISEFPAQGLTAQQMRRVVDFVQASLDQDLSLDALAQQSGFSPYHFARLFRQTTGESPHQFVLSQRVERARHLLTEKKLPLAQIALDCGFANQSHFTQAFKRQLGVTPRAYRQAC